MSDWITDAVGPTFAQSHQSLEELYGGRSALQEIRVVRNPDYGRMLILDDAVQTSEGDEFVYHEMLAHVPLLTHPAPRTVLIIGGGDGGLLEEVLKHPVERAVMVEIDPEVIAVARRFLAEIAGRAFEDPRTHLVIGDGISYLREAPERFDVILVDSPDPKGAAVGLYTEAFYADAARALAPGGLIAAQSGSALYQQDLVRRVRAHLRPAFPYIATYVAAVPTYPGVLWSLTIGATGVDPRRIAADPPADRTRGFGLRYYTSEVHRAAFHLPPFLARALDITEP